MGIKKGDKIKIKGAEMFGTVAALNADGTLLVSLDNGIEMKAREDHVTPIARNSSEETHEPNGHFKKGHPQFRPNRKKNRMKYCREAILQQLEPFIADLGTIVAQIEKPEDQILAISRIAPYAMPKLSSIEVTEKEQRNLSAEERIAKLNAIYHKKKDPTEEDEEEDD